MLTESEALAILPLEVMKLELRVPASITEHDALIQRQIWDALNFATGATGRAADDSMPLRAAAIAIVRQLYGGAGSGRALPKAEGSGPCSGSATTGG